ncbi:MAG: hypothetical protein WC157_00220 [Candidatus Paceibacterota bacterium]
MKLKTLLILTIFLLGVSFNGVLAKDVGELKQERETYLEINILDILKEEGIEAKKANIKSIDWVSQDSVLVEFKEKKKTYLLLIDFKENSNDVECVQLFEPG